MRLRFCAALALLLFLALFAAGASAASAQFSASCPACGEELVLSWDSSGGPVLFLPGAWDASSVLLVHSRWDTFLLGEDRLPVSAQSPVDLTPFLGSRVPVFTPEHKSLGSLQILQGSPVLSLHFSVDEKKLSAVNRSKNNIITEGMLSVLEGDGSVSYRGGVEKLAGRGNSTFAYSKKPYEFKLDRKASLGGIPAGKTWILLANYLDISFLRNQITLDLCRAAGLRFAIRCVQADLWLNGQYQGLYLLTEKIQIRKDRLAITDLEEATEAVNDAPLNSYRFFREKRGRLPLLQGYEIPNDPEDITGGYIAVVEKKYRMDPGSRPCFRTVKLLNVRIKEPTCPSRAQTEYFARLVNRMHLALLSPDGIDPESGLHFSRILDVSSFALKFLIEDFTKNYDIMAGSQYFYKDSDRIDPLIHAGPAWDYDLSFGAMGDHPYGAYAARTHTVSNNLWPLLAKHDLFMQTVRDLWHSAVRPAISVLLGETEAPSDDSLRSLEDYRSGIAASAVMDARRRGTRRKVHQQVGSNFDAAVDFLADWIARRAASLDELYAFPAD